MTVSAEWWGRCQIAGSLGTSWWLCWWREGERNKEKLVRRGQAKRRNFEESVVRRRLKIKKGIMTYIMQSIWMWWFPLSAWLWCAFPDGLMGRVAERGGAWAHSRSSALIGLPGPFLSGQSGGSCVVSLKASGLSRIIHFYPLCIHVLKFPSSPFQVVPPALVRYNWQIKL